MTKTTNKFAPKVRERAGRVVFDDERDHPSRSATVVSISEKVGCSSYTLHEWVRKAEVNSGKRAGRKAGETPNSTRPSTRRGAPASCS
jgi:transposase-like protein